MQAGIGQHRVDFSRLVFSGQLDPVFGITGEPSTGFLQDINPIQTYQVGFGLLARGQLSLKRKDLPFSLGGSVFRVFGSRDISFLRLEHTQAMLYTVHGAITLPIKAGSKRDDVIYLNMLARTEIEKVLVRSTLGMIFQYEFANLGLLYAWNPTREAYRNTHVLTLSTGFNFNLGETEGRVQYAFDGILSGLGQTATGGAHEFSLSFSLPNACIGKRSGRNKTDCYYFIGKGYRRFLN
ncbi:MAG: hypothetical protein IPN33_14645 [Saprospiraceae bacterium]|nr:hypothetical protein [Saprospiraceae bacterium]